MTEESVRDHYVVEPLLCLPGNGGCDTAHNFTLYIILNAYNEPIEHSGHIMAWSQPDKANQYCADLNECPDGALIKNMT